MPRVVGQRPKGFTLIEVIVVASLISIVAAIVVPNFVNSGYVGRFTACKSNLRGIATALDMYANDNRNVYPPSMKNLRGPYLAALPTCPSAMADTYSGGFSSSSNPDCYTVVCSGEHHAEVGQDTSFPQYVSGEGLISL